MPFIKVKCSSCGEVLTVDDERSTWYCRYCGTKFDIRQGERLYTGADSEFEIHSGVLTKYNGKSHEVIIPSTVSIIGDHVFENHSEITYVYFPESVSSIGAYAFLGCTGLTRINIPRIGFAEPTIQNNGSLLSDITDYLKSLSKRRCVIGKGAFGGCTELTSVELNVNEKFDRERNINIAQSAFSGCYKLSAIHIGPSITRLQQGIFDGCDERVDFIWNNLDKFPHCSNIIHNRLVKGSCIYCGGQLKGLLFKKCKDCGRPRINH